MFGWVLFDASKNDCSKKANTLLVQTEEYNFGVTQLLIRLN